MQKKEKIKIRKNDIAKYFFSSMIIIFVICFLGCILDNRFNITASLFGNNEAEGIVMDLFLVEVQVTFIVVSLSTALSTQSKRVYWVDSFQYRLIRPKYTNFIALSSYILATLVVGFIWEIIDRCMYDYNGLMGVCLSFILALVFMIILSIRMIGANFGEEAIKVELEEELEEEIKKQIEKQPVVSGYSGYSDYVASQIPMVGELVQITIKEIEEKDINHVCENIALLWKMRLKGKAIFCYEYAKKTWQFDELMTEIDYTLMRTAVVTNYTTFFYGDCPLSCDSILKCWRRMIDERFDEATVLWQEGNKEEAKKIRKELYVLFVESMYYTKLRYKLTEEQDFNLINLLWKFVMRRTNKIGSFDTKGNRIELGDGWAESEMQWIVDEEREKKTEENEDIEFQTKVEDIVDSAKETLEEWAKGNYSEEISEFVEILDTSIWLVEEF